MTSIFGDQRLPQRFWNKVVINRESGCWEWTASKNQNGYGLYLASSSPSPKRQGAHRVAFIALRFDPQDLVCDHLCRVRHCVNPDHMRAVTPKVNILAGIGFSAVNALKTHCPNGHEYTPENTATRTSEHGKYCRDCKTCAKARATRPCAFSGNESEHGTPGKYRAGCRCRECKDEQRDRMRTYRAERQAKTVAEWKPSAA